jgi:two-component system response regulator RegA
MCGPVEMSHEDQNRDGPTVLIVEDERVARRALASLLDACGYQPQPCESAEEALREVDRGTDPKYALVDIDLPGMNGLDLISHLEQMRPHTVSILMTAYEGDRVERFRRDHRVHYMRKPLDFPYLLRILGNEPGGQKPHC